MTTLRTSYKIGGTKCGSDVAGETAAAFAAASIAFKSVNGTYSAILLEHAKDLFTFATTCLGAYSDTIPEVNPYYTSYSGYKVQHCSFAIPVLSRCVHTRCSTVSYLFLFTQCVVIRGNPRNQCTSATLQSTTPSQHSSVCVVTVLCVHVFQRSVCTCVDPVQHCTVCTCVVIVLYRTYVCRHCTVAG